jgi:APA family basic amino acid/polyamine antiporter
MAALLAAVGLFGEIVAYFIFVSVIFIGLTVAAVFMRRIKERSKWGIPGYPVTPVAFLMLAAVLLALLAAANPGQSLLGVVVTVLGAPVYHLTKRKET